MAGARLAWRFAKAKRADEPVAVVPKRVLGDFPLRPHRDARPRAMLGVSVSVARAEAQRLHLSFAISGNVDGLVIPATESPARADNLWQSTCCEAFVRLADRAQYLEFNLSPSSRWAAYRFHDYRSGMRATAADDPAIAVAVEPDGLRLDAVIDLTPLGPDLPGAPLQIGLCAVIEETLGIKSYWALRHPPGKPDFHHADCFALRLAPPRLS